MKFFHVCLSLFILLSIFTICRTEDADCVYTIYVKTGSKHLAGTDSKISLTLSDGTGKWIPVNNLEAWGGLMGPGYDYFERGNLDMFTGKGPCLKGPVCAINLTSDGTGKFSGWYCDYVAVTTTGPRRKCAQKNFTVNQWLFGPFHLSARRNDCQKRINDQSEVSVTNERIIDDNDLSKINSKMLGF